MAKMMGLSRKTVYRRKVELGAVQIGAGPRPRLRFDPERIRQALRG